MDVKITNLMMFGLYTNAAELFFSESIKLFAIFN